MSPLLSYLESLRDKGAPLPSSIEELPAPWPKWFKLLPPPRETLSEDLDSEVSDRIQRMMNHASGLPESSEEHRRAKANRLYYAVISCSRVIFNSPLHEGHGAHQHFALHLLRMAIEEKKLTVEDLTRMERRRRDVYNDRIHADYRIIEPFDDVDLGRTTIKATKLFNELVELGKKSSEK